MNQKSNGTSSALVCAFVLGGLALTVSGCTRITPTAPTQTLDTRATQAVRAPDAAAQAATIDICHRAGAGFNPISINENAWPAHQAHGDGRPGGPVPGSSMVFDAACVAHNVAAPARLEAVPSSIQFADQAVGSVSTSQAITITNTGGSTASQLGGATLTGNPSDFLVVSNTCTPQSAGELSPGESCTIVVRFVPQAEGVRSDTLSLSSENANTVTVGLSGTGT